MASIEKFTHDAICSQHRHIDRQCRSPSNKDIDTARTHLNYSFQMDHNGLSPFNYYKQLIDAKYLYGRGTQRERTAITGCGWVVTLPQELRGNPDQEHAFFQGVFDFICERYGERNIINNAVHYDEGGMPHIHVLFVPVTALDHEVVQHKTKKTDHAVRLESGRYEFSYKFLLDEQGEKIKIKNYSKKTDSYDEKIDANTVINKAELQHFHTDLQQYLIQHGIAGKVVTGKTGTNFSVKELKEFTASTGLHLNEVRELQQGESILQNIVDHDQQITKLEEQINHLMDILSSRDKEISKLNDINKEFSQKIEYVERELESVRSTDRSRATKNQGWNISQGWDRSQNSGWNQNKTIEEEIS